MKIQRIKLEKLFFFLIISLILVFLDRLTKIFLYRGCFFIFCIERVNNKGAIFGLFQGMNVLFVFIALFVMFFSVYFYKRTENNFLKISLILIFSGTFGNFIDRIFYGEVIDVLNFSFWASYPTFNLADAEISLGIVFLFLFSIKI